MTAPPLFFSIITASLNNGTTIKNTIESIKNQSFEGVEHIVIDGGSRDATVSILKEYEKIYNLTWVSEPDEGIAHALNKGLNFVNGKYILVIQADDSLIDKNILSNIYSLLRDEMFDLYCFPVVRDDPMNVQKTDKYCRNLWYHHLRNIFPHQGVFINKRLFNMIGKYNQKYEISMDYDFFYRALINRCSIKFKDIPVAFVGTAGISSLSAFLLKRLQEEKAIQKLNENNIFWKAVQKLFWVMYPTYKRIITAYVKL